MCPTGCRSSRGQSAGSATAASGTWETCRPTRRRCAAAGRPRRQRPRRGTATPSPDTRRVRSLVRTVLRTKSDFPQDGYKYNVAKKIHNEFQRVCWILHYDCLLNISKGTFIFIMFLCEDLKQALSGFS